MIVVSVNVWLLIDAHYNQRHLMPSSKKNIRTEKLDKQQDNKTPRQKQGQREEREKEGRERDKKRQWINGPIKNFRKKKMREDDAT